MDKIFRSAKQGVDGDGKFIKNLAAALWTNEELAGRSALGLVCPQKKDENPRPECTPAKKDFMKCKHDYSISKSC